MNYWSKDDGWYIECPDCEWPAILEDMCETCDGMKHISGPMAKNPSNDEWELFFNEYPSCRPKP